MASNSGETSIPDDLLDGITVQRQVQTRADADFQHPTSSTADDALSVWQQQLPAHRQVSQPGKQVSCVKAHLLIYPGFRRRFPTIVQHAPIVGGP
jgi:hypothetical protein